MAVLIPFFVVSVALLINSSHECEETKFSYSGEKGPQNWGSLDPKYAECSNGKLQSPIAIVKDEALLNTNLKPLTRKYHATNATLVNHGYVIGIHAEEPAGVLLLNGKDYFLEQMHWHAPSEHLIDGVRYEAELHMVHKAKDGSISVVGILYQLGNADPLLAKINKELRELWEEECGKGKEAQIALGQFNFMKLQRNTVKYFTYNGSLTTPPCSETVLWHLHAKVRSISKEQVAALRAPLGSEYQENARPVQPLNCRQVQLFDEFA